MGSSIEKITEEYLTSLEGDKKFRHLFISKFFTPLITSTLKDSLDASAERIKSIKLRKC